MASHTVYIIRIETNKENMMVEANDGFFEIKKTGVEVVASCGFYRKFNGMAFCDIFVLDEKFKKDWMKEYNPVISKKWYFGERVDITTACDFLRECGFPENEIIEFSKLA
jgi:hypothetical protein